MILRKPYAFLIKHFRSINFILFLFISIMLIRILRLYSFIKDYMNTGIYNVTLIPITRYINVFIYLLIALIIVISVILSYLLYKKDKPIKIYVYTLIVMALTLGVTIFVHNYFTFTAIKGYDLQMAKLLRDIVLIESFFYYPIILILMIRFIGIDLNNFGFREDKEILASEEDREEVEVEVTFDKHKYFRQIKKTIRETKYFVLEHLYAIIPLILLVVLIGLINTYKFVFVDNKVYKQNETFKANGFNIKINKTYLTDKDYRGDIISSKSRFYVIVDFSIKNTYYEREFDYNKMSLYVDNLYYLPTIAYNNSFVDLGKPYDKGYTIAKNDTKNYILIYEVTRPKDGANFLLKYQDLWKENREPIRIKLKMLDISEFKDRDTSVLGESIRLQLNKNLSYEFSISNLKLTDEAKYTYESCTSGYKCPIYEKKIVPSSGKILMTFKINGDEANTTYIDLLKKYGTIKYIVDGITYEEKVKLKIEKYRGNNAYIEVSKNVLNADEVTLMFTIRTNRYYYKLMG